MIAAVLFFVLRQIWRLCSLSNAKKCGINLSQYLFAIHASKRFGFAEMCGNLLYGLFLRSPYRIAERSPMRVQETARAVFFLFSVWVSRVPNIASCTCKICNAHLVQRSVETFVKLLSKLHIEKGTWFIVVNTQKERKRRLFLYRIRTSTFARVRRWTINWDWFPKPSPHVVGKSTLLCSCSFIYKDQNAVKYPKSPIMTGHDLAVNPTKYCSCCFLN